MKHFQKFQMAIFSEVQPIIERDFEKRGPNPPPDSSPEVTDEERRLLDLFRACFAIDDAFKNMKMSLRYVEVSSRRPNDIKKEEHIRYHYENFFQGAYILKEKLSRILPEIYILGGNWVNKKKNKTFHNSVRDQLKKIFKNISTIRDAHVHHPRGYFDKTLSNAQMYSLVSEHKKEDFEAPYNLALLLLKWEKIEELKGLLVQFEKTSESLFEGLNSLFFKGENLNLPKKPLPRSDK